MRIYGLNSIALPSKWNYSLSALNEKSSEAQKETAAEFLVGRGFYEVMNNSLTKKQYSAMLDASFGTAISMLNPLSQDLAHLRQTLHFGLLENLAYNQNRQQADLQIFEFGQDYQTQQEKHRETPRLSIALTGKQAQANWHQATVENHSFFSLKKEVYAILERFGLAHACKVGVGGGNNDSPAIEKAHWRKSGIETRRHRSVGIKKNFVARSFGPEE